MSAVVTVEESNPPTALGRFPYGAEDEYEDDCFDVPQVSPNAVAEIAACPRRLQQTLLLDVRTPCEFACERIPGAVLIALNELADRCQELDWRQPVVCLCTHGVRSESAVRLLLGRGFSSVTSMRGGLVRYPGPLVRGYCPDAP